MNTCLALSCLLLAANLVAGAVPVVTNPSTPPQIEILTLRELWRVDLDDPEAPLIGAVSAAAAGPDGTILVLDSQLAQVAVFAADGAFRQFIGGKGEGPGEVQNPLGLVLPGDGRIGMLQMWPARVVFVNLDGTPAGTLTAKATTTMFSRVQMRGNTIVACSMDWVKPEKAGENRDRLSISRLSPDGAAATTFLEKMRTTVFDPPSYDEGTSFFPQSQWCLTADGLVVLAPERDRYRLEFRALDGTLVRTVERPCKPRRRTGADREELAVNITYTRGDQVLDVTKHILDDDPAIESILLDAKENLSIYHAYSRRDLPPGIALRWDVLDPEGHWLKEVRLAADVDWKNDVLAEVGNGRWLLVRNAAAAAATAYAMPDRPKGLKDEPMVIVCYEAVAR